MIVQKYKKVLKKNRNDMNKISYGIRSNLTHRRDMFRLFSVDGWMTIRIYNFRDN